MLAKEVWKRACLLESICKTVRIEGDCFLTVKLSIIVLQILLLQKSVTIFFFFGLFRAATRHMEVPD